MHHERIIISNLSEAFYDFLQVDNEEFQNSLALEKTIEEQAVFWGGDNSLIITSYPIHKTHLQHLEKALAYRNIETVFPQNSTGKLNDDILNDYLLFDKLITLTAKDQVEISPYCISPEFVGLVDHMISHGTKPLIPDLPDRQNLCFVKQIDLKSGFRQLATSLISHPIKVPRGYSCKTLDEICTVTEFFMKNRTTCIIKPDNGEDGIGQTKILNGSSHEDIVKDIYSNKFIRRGDAIVEQFIEPHPAIDSPSIEYYIKNGRLFYLYSCAQTLSANRTFLGVDVGPNTIPNKIKKEMVKMGNSFGSALIQLGYKGFFDMDFIVDANKDVYAVEANLRRTGATHVHKIGTQLFGNHYEKEIYLRSSDVDPCVQLDCNIDNMFAKLDEILFPNLGSKRGVIITISAGIPEGRLGYVIIGQSQNEITSLQDNLYRRLA